MNIFSYDEGLVDVGELNGVSTQKPTKLLLTLNIEGTEARNSHELWVYPKKALEKEGRYHSQGFESGSGESWKRAERCWMPTASSHFVAADDTLSQADNATPYTVGGLSRPITGIIACSRPSARTTRRRFLQEPWAF